MPTTPRRRVTRTSASKFSPKDFQQRMREFLTNKAMIEIATLRNDGDSKKGEAGLKDRLKTEVMTYGEEDPESGSFFYILPEPIDIPETGKRFKRVKAERRAGSKSLDVEATRELLEAKGLLDDVEEFTYSLRMDAETAERFGEWLEEADMTKFVTGTNSVIVEDNLLALHARKDPKTKDRLISEEELDSLYTTGEATFAFKPLTD